MGSAHTGSNPVVVDFFFFIFNVAPQRMMGKEGSSRVTWGGGGGGGSYRSIGVAISSCCGVGSTGVPPDSDGERLALEAIAADGVGDHSCDASFLAGAGGSGDGDGASSASISASLSGSCASTGLLDSVGLASSASCSSPAWAICARCCMATDSGTGIGTTSRRKSRYSFCCAALAALARKNNTHPYHRSGPSYACPCAH